MANDTSVLIMLVIFMLIGSYTAGSIPLIMKLSEAKLKILTVLGAGLLVGTALTVIIPEGIRSLYLYGGTSNQLSMDHMPSTLAVADIKHLISNEAEQDPTYNFTDHSRTIGLSLALGFTFMMLIDQVSQRRQNSSSTTTDERKITATLGLVVHAAADGIALGAAATTSHHDVELIVFLAIMLHKAPAAFGLVSFLLHEKIERQRIRRHLMIFSSSAPLLTLLTYFSIGQEQKKTLDSVNATAIAMLFSAGTFLYVATVHVLPELTHRENGGHRHASLPMNQYNYNPTQDPAKTCTVDIQQQQQIATRMNSGRRSSASSASSSVSTLSPPASTNGLRYIELLFMICGILLPLSITFGHHH